MGTASWQHRSQIIKSFEHRHHPYGRPQTPSFPLTKLPIAPTPPPDFPSKPDVCGPALLQPSCTMPKVPPCGRPRKCPSRLSGNTAHLRLPESRPEGARTPGGVTQPGHPPPGKQVAEPGPQWAVATQSPSGHPDSPRKSLPQERTVSFPTPRRPAVCHVLLPPPGLKHALPSLREPPG